MFDIKKVAALCAVAALAFTGCGKSKDKSDVKIKEVGTNYTGQEEEPEEESPTAEPVTATASFGEVCENEEKTIAFDVVSIKYVGEEYEDTDTQIVVADVKITNNTDEKLTPSSLSYFAVYNENGEREGGTNLRAQLIAARTDEKAFFVDGVEPGETAESNVYLEIPRSFTKLSFAYCPDTFTPDGYSPLSLITLFTPDDIQPADSQ